MRRTESPQMGLTSLQTDSLYCQEEHYWDAEENVDIVQPPELRFLAPPAPEDEWVDLLSTLAAKERDTHLEIPDGYPGAGGAALYLHSARRGAVQWVARACAVHGFSAMTALLAVSYLDRCFLGGGAAAAAGGGGGLRLQAELPWMERLSAVACLSLAAKVEETQVPLLLDLQAAAAEGGGSAAGEYIFEAKTVRRMELLILSTLGWRMISVTPLSFIEHILPKVAAAAAGGGGAPLTGVLKSSNAILLSVVADWRWVTYPASVWAASVLLHVLEEMLEPVHVLALLGLTKETVEGCYYLILEARDMNTTGNKRKQFPSYDHSSPPSPNGVLNSCFSCDSSCDSWAATWSSSVSSSPEPRPFKRLNYGGNEE